jgi:hypothetical protein
MANEMPLLQIIHYSDIHLARDGYLKTRWELKRAYPTLSRDHQQGWAGARRAVLNEFIRVIRGLTAGDAAWKDQPAWLVDTGDGTTFGDSDSLAEWNWWSKQFTRAAQPHGRLMRVYGNHDGWPGTFPMFAPAKMDAQRDMLRATHFTATWPEPPWAVAVPGLSSRIELCAVNTVDHSLVPNALALGVAARDRHWNRRQTIPIDTPAEDLALQAQAQTPGSSAPNLRIAAMHYPVAHAATPGNPKTQKVLANRSRFANDLRRHAVVQPLVTHLLLAGHTHLPFPSLGHLPRSAGAAQHVPLVDGQCQIVTGSLSQQILQVARLKPNATWAETREFHSPYQCTVLRFYSQPDDPTEIIMERAILGADDSAIFDYLPISIGSKVTTERMSFRI